MSSFKRNFFLLGSLALSPALAADHVEVELQDEVAANTGQPADVLPPPIAGVDLEYLDAVAQSHEDTLKRILEDHLGMNPHLTEAEAMHSLVEQLHLTDGFIGAMHLEEVDWAALERGEKVEIAGHIVDLDFLDWLHYTHVIALDDVVPEPDSAEEEQSLRRIAEEQRQINGGTIAKDNYEWMGALWDSSNPHLNVRRRDAPCLSCRAADCKVEDCRWYRDPPPPTPETCFSLESMVETETGVKTMRELKVGESVKVNDGSFSLVVGYLDRDEDAPTAFLELVTANGSITLTSEHLLMTEAGMMQAGDVKLGTRLVRESGDQEPVIEIMTKILTGFGAPLTQTGTIVVDNYQASNYASVTPSILWLVDLVMWPRRMVTYDSATLGWDPYATFLNFVVPAWIYAHSQ